jgi:ABC-type enterochelin transport system permease subunit
MPGNPLTDPNWAADVANTIDRYVGKVRTTVTERAVLAVRAVVFGIVIAIAAPVTFALLLILGTKLAQRIIAIATDHDSAVWISYVAVGGILVLAGSFMMRKRFESDPA